MGITRGTRGKTIKSWFYLSLKCPKNKKKMQDEFVRCCYAGDAKRVRELLADARIDPTAQSNIALRWAAYNEHADVMRVLLADPRVSPSAEQNSAIYSAVTYNGIDAFQLLRADTRVDDLEVIMYASGWCARLLACDSRFGIGQHRQVYEKYHPTLVAQYDAALARGLTMAWVARGIRASYDARNVSGLPAWESLVEPVAKRLKAGFV
jgi:hypothetical protein